MLVSFALSDVRFIFRWLAFMKKKAEWKVPTIFDNTHDIQLYVKIAYHGLWILWSRAANR